MRGQSLIEILLTIGLAAILLPALLIGLFASRSGRAQLDQHLQAVTQLQQTQEAVRSIRESGWATIATNGTYHPVSSGSTWTLIPGNQSVNGLTQQVVIADVYRDSVGNIVSSGGSLDPSTKALTTTISWSSPYASQVQSTMYLTRYLGNASHTDTSAADFNAGTKTGVVVTNVSGGEVTLGVGGNADWCKPQNSLINLLTLPKKGNTISALPGGAYVGTGDGTAGTTFVNVGITQPAPPASPSASIAGTYTSSYKTNAIYSDGHYVYLAADGASSQVVILDISHTPYTKVGWIDVPSGVGANGIYVDSNNIAYVTSSNRLYTFDLTTRTGGHSSPLTSIAMWISFLSPNPLAKQVVVVNGYAYVGTANTLFGLQKFRVGNNGASLTLVGVSNLAWQQASQGLSVNSSGSRAYVAFDQGSGFFPKGFFIVDTSAPDPAPWWFLPNFYDIIGTFNAGTTDPRGMAIASSTRAIVVGDGGAQQYQVIDISNEQNPVLCGGLSLANGATGVATVQSNNVSYSYLITGESSNQFKIIQGGTGGAFAASGTFESATFDASSAAAFNNFLADVTQPASTQAKLQIAVAAPVSGSCNGVSYTYLGPNADPSQYFTPVGATISASIPFGTFGASYVNPGRCYRYKLTLSTPDTTQTPVLYDMSTNYSP